MSDRTTTIVPRRRRDEQIPAAPMDPFVSQFLRWFAEQGESVSLTGLAKRAALGLNWPAPFADAVLTAARTRKLLALAPTGPRGGYRAGLSTRGIAWLEQHND